MYICDVEKHPAWLTFALWQFFAELLLTAEEQCAYYTVKKSSVRAICKFALFV